MLLTFLIDPPFLLFLGYLFALAIPFASTRPLVKTRAFLAGLVVFVIFDLAVVLSCWWFPDWMWMYFVEASRHPFPLRGLALLIALIVYYVLYCLGFLWGARAKAQVGGTAWWGAAMLAAASGLIILPVWDRYYQVGTMAEFLAGQGVPLPQSPLASVYNIALPCMAILGAIGFWSARKER